MGTITRAITLLALVSMFAVGGTALASGRQASLTTVSLQLKWAPQAQFAGYFVADKKGFYKKQGLKVNILSGGPQVTPEQVVEEKQAQFGIDWLPSLLHERDKGGNPVVNIAQLYQSTGMRMISYKKLHIKGPKNFPGHSVGVWPAGNQYQFFALMHKLHYKCSVTAFSCDSSTKIKVESEQFSMNPFIQGQLDVSQAMTYNEMGLVTEKPPVGAGVPKSKLNIIDYNKLGVSMLEDGLFAQPSWLKSHSSIAVKFVKASMQGWAYAVKHPTTAGKISFQYAKSTGTTQKHQIFMAKAVAKLVESGLNGHPVGWMNPTSYKRTWKESKQDAVITKKPSHAYDQSYWKKATKGM